MTGGYRVLASVLIDEEKEEIRVCPSLHLLEMRTRVSVCDIEGQEAVNDVPQTPEAEGDFETTALC